jgi:hypothetical protein
MEHQIMPYGFDFVVKILLILTNNLCSVDQTMNPMNYSPFHVMWVIGLEV